MWFRLGTSHCKQGLASHLSHRIVLVPGPPHSSLVFVGKTMSLPIARDASSPVFQAPTNKLECLSQAYLSLMVGYTRSQPIVSEA